MNDHQLDELIARAAPISDADIADWIAHVGLTDPLVELCEVIMSTTTAMDGHPQVIEAAPTYARRERRHTGRVRRRRRVAAFGAAAAVIVGLVLISNLGATDRHTGQAWAAPLVAFAERSPLLLLDQPGWTVTRADETGDEGEMTFTNGPREADLNWRDGPLSEWLDDRLADGANHGQTAVPHGSATVVQYNATTEFTALWQADGHVVEFRTNAPTVDEFRGLLGALTIVDVDTWLSAMPDGVIEQPDQPGVIEEMLTGIPLPAGFDTTTLADDTQIKDRYQLGARVVAAVSCAWIGQWIDATAIGDTGSAQAAVEAMNTSSQWPIIQEMNASGAYGEVLQQYATAMTNGGRGLGEDDLSVADSYQGALGCPPAGDAHPVPTAPTPVPTSASRQP